MHCKYYAQNGKPSILFDRLFSALSENENITQEEAEKAAVRIWITTHTESFKQFYGSSDISEYDENNEPVIVKEDDRYGFRSNLFEKDDPFAFQTISRWGSDFVTRQEAFAYTNTDYSIPRSSIWGTTNIANEDSFYLTNNYYLDMVLDKKINVVFKSENLKSGIYKYGDTYLRVTNKGLNTVSSVNKPMEMINDSLSFSDMDPFLVKEFLNNNIPLYSYDIKVLNDADKKMALEKENSMDLAIKHVKDSVANSEVFAKYVTAISDNIKRLEQQKKLANDDFKKKQELSKQIKDQEEVLKELKSNKSAIFLIKTGEAQMQNVAQSINSDNVTAFELKEGLRLAMAWAGLSDMIDLDKHGKTDQEVSLIDDAIAVMGRAADLVTKIHKQIADYITAEAAKNNISFSKEKEMYFDSTGKLVFSDLSFLGSQGISTEFSGKPIEQLLNAVIRKGEFEQLEEMHKNKKESNEKAKELLGSENADTSFMTTETEIKYLNSAGDTVIEKRQSLVTMYDAAFYEEYYSLLRNAIDKKIKWKEFKTFERKNFEYELTDEGVQAFEKYIEEMRSSYIIGIEDDGEFIYDEEKFNKLKNDFDPKKYIEFIEDTTGTVEPNNGNIWFNKVPKDHVKLNPAYERLNEKQKEYYNWFVNKMAEMTLDRSFDYRLGPVEIDSLLLNQNVKLAEGFGSQLKYAWDKAIEFSKNTVMTVASSTYSSDVRSPITNKTAISPTFKPMASFLPKNGKRADAKEVLEKFMDASAVFRQQQKAEELLNLLVDVSDAGLKIEVNNSGLHVVLRSGEKLLTRSESNLSARMTHRTNAYLKHISSDPSTAKSGSVPGSKSFSLDQTVKSLNKLTRLRYMALSPVSSTGNLLMGLANNSIYASANVHFSDKELAQAMFKMKFSPIRFITKLATFGKTEIGDPEAEKIAQIMLRYNLMGDVTENMVYGDSAISKLFVLQKGGEFLVQGASAVAQMLHIKIKLDNGKEITLYDLFKMKDGELIFDTSVLPEESEWHNSEKLRIALDTIKAVNQKIHGDYSNPLLIKKTVFGQSLMLFRTWLPMAIKERFGKEYTHPTLGVQKGRYLSAWSVLKGVVKKDDDNKNVIDVKGFEDVGRLLLKFFPLVNNKLQLSDRLSEVDQQNITMFVRETQFLVTCIMANIALKGLMSGNDDDDKEEDSGYIKYLYNQGTRLQNELSMFASPSSAMQMIQSVVPMSATLVDAQKFIVAGLNYIDDPESDIYKRGFRKGKSKVATRFRQFMPITHSVESTWSSFNNAFNRSVESIKSR